MKVYFPKKIYHVLIFLLVFYSTNVFAATYISVGSSKEGSVSQGSYVYYRFYKRSGNTYYITLNVSSGDADLYGYWTSEVSKDTYQYGSDNGGTDTEEFSFSTSSDGYYYLAVYGYRNSSYKIIVSDSASDTTKPTGQISGISSSYSYGSNSVYYTAKGWDNNNLYKLNFTVTNSSGTTKHNKEWYVSGTSVSKSYNFNTNGWEPGTYYYALWVKDAADNAKDYPGQFTISDITKPTGQISGINSSYSQGSNTIYYTAKGYDNYNLNKLNFTVTNGSGTTKHNKYWYVSGTSVSKSYNFNTNGWEPGTYYYALWVKDAAGNAKDYPGQFTISDTTKPTGQLSGINSSYNQGSNTIYYTAKGYDNYNLSKLNFTVTNSSGTTKHNKEWYVSGTSASKSYNFNTNGWDSGTYYYALWVKDAA